MWKDALLQGLIALLPIFLFLIWYDRPHRARYIPLFFSLFCGISFVLDAEFAVRMENSTTSLGFAPLLIGSLYGGAWAATLLTLVFVVYHIFHYADTWQFIHLVLFTCCYMIPLVWAASRYSRLSRHKQKRVVLAFFGGLWVFFFAGIMERYKETPSSVFWNDMLTLLLFWAFFSATIIVSVRLIEMGHERVNLQKQLRLISTKYRGEVQRLQQLIDQAPLAVIFMDDSGKVTHVNEFSLHLFQSLNRHIVGKHSEVLSRLLLLQSPSPIERVIRGEERVVEMIRLQGKTVYTVTCMMKGTPGESTDTILFLGHDVTELEKLRDELGRMERLSLVGQMAASITHEIRNPMAVIRGFVQLLNERSSSEQQAYFRIVMEELDRANGIISDFLSLAQNRIVEKELVSLHEVLNDLMPLIWADANMRGQIVELNLCEAIEPLEISGKEIKQLVLNLARNGMEAMGDKGILRIETKNTEETVQLTVADRGVGIPPEKLERLFEPFFTTKTNGTGLGLALCLSIVERHNGKIRVESKVGEGTSFVVSFSKSSRRAG